MALRAHQRSPLLLLLLLALSSSNSSDVDTENENGSLYAAANDEFNGAGDSLPPAALPEVLERLALREFESLPASMGPAAATGRSMAVRLAEKRLKKKACKQRRRVECALLLATSLAADGQHAAAVEAAKAALLDRKSRKGTVAEPFTLFWLAQHAAHIGALADPDPVLEEAAAILFERVTELQEPPDLLNCVGLLEPQRRAQQMEACSNTVDHYCQSSDQSSLLPCRVAHHWAGLLQLDSVLGGLLPDELSPPTPSDGWRNTQPDRLVARLLSKGCSSLAAAASGGNAEPGLLKANYSCAALQAATESRRLDSRVARTPTTDFKPIRRLDVETVTSAGSLHTAASHQKGEESAAAIAFWRSAIEKGEPIVVTGSSTLGLGGQLGWEAIREMCGDLPLRESEAAYLGEPSTDSVRSTAISVESVRIDPVANARSYLRLRDGLLASRDAVRNASLIGAPVGVSGWALSACPALSETVTLPEFAMTSRGYRDWLMPAETAAGNSDGSPVWGWSSARIYACPQGSASALHSDLHHSHHVLALLEGGPKEYVIFPADPQTRARLLYNHVAGQFELGKLDDVTGTFSDTLRSIDDVRWMPIVITLVWLDIDWISRLLDLMQAESNSKATGDWCRHQC
jgi:hypothetical protein